MAFRVRSDHKDPRTGQLMPHRAWDGPTPYDFSPGPDGAAGEIPLDADVAQRLVAADPLLRIVGMDHEIQSNGTVLFRSKTGQYTRERPLIQMIDGKNKFFYNGCEWTAPMEHIRWMIDRLSGNPEVEFSFPEHMVRGAQPAEAPLPTNPWQRLQHIAYNHMGVPRQQGISRPDLMRAMWIQDPGLAAKTFDGCSYRYALEADGTLIVDPPDDFESPKETGGAGAVRV